MTSSRASELHRVMKANQQILQVLENSKTMADGVVDELPILLAMLDDEYRLLKLNITGQRLLRRDERAALGQPLSTLLPKATVAKIVAYIEQPATTGRTDRLTFEDMIEVDGSTRYFLWELGKPFGRPRSDRHVHVLLGSDITEARLAFEQLVGMRKDLEVARAVQAMLVPDKSVVVGPYYEMIGYSEPAQQVSGDFWWHTEVPGVGLFSIVADVTGHGIGSAMVASTLTGMLAATLTREPHLSAAATADTVAELGELASKLLQENFFICYAVVVLHRHEPKATVFGAGFPPLLLLRQGQKPELITLSGNPLGNGTSRPEFIYEVDFGPGDRLVAFTDGCYEARTQESTLTQRRQFIKSLVAHADLPLAQAKSGIAAAHSRHHGAAVPDDDVTFVIIDRKVEAQP